MFKIDWKLWWYFLSQTLGGYVLLVYILSRFFFFIDVSERGQGLICDVMQWGIFTCACASDGAMGFQVVSGFMALVLYPFYVFKLVWRNSGKSFFKFFYCLYMSGVKKFLVVLSFFFLLLLTVVVGWVYSLRSEDWLKLFSFGFYLYCVFPLYCVTHIVLECRK